MTSLKAPGKVPENLSGKPRVSSYHGLTSNRLEPKNPHCPCAVNSLTAVLLTGRWNSEIVGALVKGATETMTQKHGVLAQNIHIESVPGSWELPISVSRLVSLGKKHQADASKIDRWFSSHVHGRVIGSSWLRRCIDVHTRAIWIAQDMSVRCSDRNRSVN